MILAQKQSQNNRKLSIDNGGKRAEFAEKTALLRASYPQMPAFDFYDYLYNGDQAPKVYAIDGKTYSRTDLIKRHCARRYADFG